MSKFLFSKYKDDRGKQYYSQVGNHTWVLSSAISDSFAKLFSAQNSYYVSNGNFGKLY